MKDTAYKVTFFPDERVYRVQNPNGGATLTYSADSGMQLLEVRDGEYLYAFKDLDRDGKLSPYEDWRLPVEERARDLASRLSVEEMAGLMLYPVQEPTDGEEKRAAQMEQRHIRFFLSNRSTREDSAQWSNAMQARAEKNDPHGIPVNIASDPRNTIAGGRFVVFNETGMSGWPGNLGLAATFHPKYTLLHGQVASREYRAYGITTALSPQVDLATEPRWSRFAGTFGEGSKLAGDCAAAYVHGFQSTWDGLGAEAKDLGWGKDSVVAMIKHFPGDGAAEGGREAHNNFGKYNVYPGDNLAEHLSVFEQAFEIPDSKTGGAKAVMPS
jgi:beta-glucosidase